MRRIVPSNIPKSIQWQLHNLAFPQSYFQVHKSSYMFSKKVVTTLCPLRSPSTSRKPQNNPSSAAQSQTVFLNHLSLAECIMRSPILLYGRCATYLIATLPGAACESSFKHISLEKKKASTLNFQQYRGQIVVSQEEIHINHIIYINI